MGLSGTARHHRSELAARSRRVEKLVQQQYHCGELARLQQRIGTAPRLSLGCDFHLSYENFQHVLRTPELYTIDGGHYLLVELSNYSIPAQVDECFTQLGDRSITPVITHPERNPILQQDLPRVLRWVELGCAVQVTASALTGDWGERVWRSAEWLLKRDAVHVLATATCASWPQRAEAKKERQPAEKPAVHRTESDNPGRFEEQTLLPDGRAIR